MPGKSGEKTLRRCCRTTVHIDRFVHEPVRLKILMLLSGVKWADFASLCRTLGLTRGNLSAHASTLERRGYVQVSKSIVGKTPHTQYRITRKGRMALSKHWASLEKIRKLGAV